jgi:hypothetical protein
LFVRARLPRTRFKPLSKSGFWGVQRFGKQLVFHQHSDLPTGPCQTSMQKRSKRIMSERENILSALREKPLKVFEIMRLISLFSSSRRGQRRRPAKSRHNANRCGNCRKSGRNCEVVRRSGHFKTDTCTHGIQVFNGAVVANIRILRQTFGWPLNLRPLESATFNHVSSPNWQIAQNFLQFC